MKKFLKFTLIIFITWFSLHSVYIIVDGFSDRLNNADVAIVFGNKVNEDGTLSPRLKARLDKSLELYNQNRIQFVIVSGGLGKEGFLEAEKMKDYLLENKIPDNKIIVDNNGTDTEKTVENSIKLMKKLHLKSAISVSQYFHQTRTKKLFRKKGFTNIESASPKYFEIRDFYSIFREFVAFYKETL